MFYESLNSGCLPSSQIIHYKKGCTRLATACDKVYQLLALGQWFSPGTPASSTTKTGRHGIAEILLKVDGMFYESLNSGCLPSSQFIEH
jgi:hypothetical protein